jgi:hypothetical protein
LVEGFGQSYPSTINLGGGSPAGGYVQQISWSAWGQNEAIGHGNAIYVTNPNGPISEQPSEPVTVLAYDLGSCGGGAPAYTELNWYYPTMGQSGPDPSTAIDACTGVGTGAPATGSETAPLNPDTGPTGTTGNTGSVGNTGATSDTGSSGKTGNS